MASGSSGPPCRPPCPSAWVALKPRAAVRSAATRTAIGMIVSSPIDAAAVRCSSSPVLTKNHGDERIAIGLGEGEQNPSGEVLPRWSKVPEESAKASRSVVFTSRMIADVEILFAGKGAVEGRATSTPTSAAIAQRDWRANRGPPHGARTRGCPRRHRSSAATTLGHAHPRNTP